MSAENFRARMSHFFPFEPTRTQAEVLDTLASFLHDEDYDADHAIFVLRGYAGTGKSSLIGALARTMLAEGRPLVLLAPTGRAAKVLQSYCGIPAHTIHRVIYRERMGANGESNFEMGYNRGRHDTLYIVDEASMINNTPDGISPFGSGCLLDDLMDFCFSVDGAKVLFIGDDAQLPPVGTPLSPAMDTRYLSRYTGRIFTGTLTDIVRQDEASEIVTLSHILRARIIDMEGGLSEWETPLLPMPSGEEVKIVSGYDLPDLVESSYAQVGKEETILLTRSNKDAEEFNRQIRYRSLGYEDDITPGELLMVCRNNYFHTPTDAEGHPKSLFVANGELLHVERSRRTKELHGFTFREAELTDTEGGIIHANIILESLYSGAAALTPEQRQRLFDSVVLDYPWATNKKQLYGALRKDPYLNALQIKYAYAMTCHKAQGGQWHDVYIHFGYLTPEMIDVSFCRWLYTAMTRASSRLYFISPPDFIFGKWTDDY